MAAPIALKDYAPYAAPLDETALDTVTGSDGNVEVEVTVKLVGTVANVQADWATLAAVALASPECSITWSAD